MFICPMRLWRFIEYRCISLDLDNGSHESLINIIMQPPSSGQSWLFQMDIVGPFQSFLNPPVFPVEKGHVSVFEGASRLL